MDRDRCVRVHACACHRYLDWGAGKKVTSHVACEKEELRKIMIGMKMGFKKYGGRGRWRCGGRMFGTLRVEENLTQSSFLKNKRSITTGKVILS